MSSKFLMDNYSYKDYSIESYQQNRGPPLISTIARILVAVTQNDVETLQLLLDDPKWYKVCDKCGFNLLEIAILRKNDEVFYYLLSLDDYPFDALDAYGNTALVTALCYYDIDDPEIGFSMSDCYAFELVKKGADISMKSFEGNSLLHCALSREYVRVARLLVERGADVNMLCNGWTPLHECMDLSDDDLNEAVPMLLCYGADPSIIGVCTIYTILDSILLSKRVNMLVAQETLFNFTIDEWSSYRFYARSLLQLAQNKSPLFHQVIKFSSEIIIDDVIDHYCFYLFTIDPEYLRILLEIYPYLVRELLQSYSENSHFCYEIQPYACTFNLKNFDTLIQSSLSLEVIELISKLNTTKLIPFILETGKNVNEIVEMIYYLLSYGMSLNDIDLENIYRKTGYSKDFKNLLFMDVEKKIVVQITEMMPRLIYDVTLDIHKTVEDISLCEFINWDQIFHYFVHPKIQNAYQVKFNAVFGRQLPQIPLLQELARDAFRKYFLKMFKITTAKEFYTLIKSLPISSVLKKIITFESKLYYLYN